MKNKAVNICKYAKRNTSENLSSEPRNLLTGELIPEKNVFTAKALLDSSSLHYLQELWNLKNREGTWQ